MNAKLKYALAVVALVVVVAASVGITYGVMAARTVTLTSPINVGYTARNVAATLSAKYKLGSTETSFLTNADDSESKTITFNGTEKETNGENQKSFVSPGALEFDTNHKIEFIFTIKNDAPEGGSNITATLTIPATKTNVREFSKTGDSYTVTVTPGETATYSIVFEVDDKTLNAQLSGDFSWTLA